MKRIIYGLSSIVLMLLLATSCQSIFDDETSITPQEIEKIEEFDHSAFICFFRPELMPSFPGGQSALFKFMAENLTWPESCKESTVGGMMVVQFTVEPDGSITNSKVVKSLHPDFDQVGLNLINRMPNWIPGRRRGMPTRTQMNLPIRIHLE